MRNRKGSKKANEEEEQKEHDDEEDEDDDDLLDDGGNLNKIPVVRDADEKEKAKLAAIEEAKIPNYESKMKKVLTRTVFAFLMIGGFLGIVFGLGHLGVCALVIVLQTLVYRELIALRYASVKIETDNSLKWFRSLQYAWFFTAMVFAYGTSWLKAPLGALDFLNKLKRVLPSYGIVDELSGVQAISFALYSLCFTFTVLSFQKGLYRVQLIQLTWTCLTLILIVAQLKFAVFMIHEGMFWFLFPVSLVVANDTFAYFSGIAFGKKIFSAPFLQISPNKTWEGFFGSLILTIVYAIYGARIWGSIDFIRCGFAELQNPNRHRCFSDHLFVGGEHGEWAPIQYHAIFYALFASLVAPFGGFFASAVKRAFRIKDFDSIIPGHGGVTDRMDCQFIMSLFGYVYYTTFIASLHLKLPLAQLKGNIESLSSDDQIELLDFLKQLISNESR